MRRWITACAAVLALVNCSGAEDVPETIRIWGSGPMQTVVNRWANHFSAIHPFIRVDATLLGTETAMAGLYSGVADLALMGRRATPKEIMAFEWVFKYKPLEIAIMTGSLNRLGKSPALVVFVHRDNPISRVTLAQLDAIFSCERLPGSSPIENWGQLGLKGNWTEREIQAYGFNTETGQASFFERVVMNGSRKWNWPRLHEFKRAEESLDALGKDPAGIALSNLCYTNPRVKPLALTGAKSDQFYAPTRESLIAQHYPLTRLAYAYVNRPPGKPIPAVIRQFLEYVLSNAGQAEVTEGGYLPLNNTCIEEQRTKMR